MDKKRGLVVSRKSTGGGGQVTEGGKYEKCPFLSTWEGWGVEVG